MIYIDQNPIRRVIEKVNTDWIKVNDK
jgi:hypothetical protein